MLHLPRKPKGAAAPVVKAIKAARNPRTRGAWLTPCEPVQTLPVRIRYPYWYVHNPPSAFTKQLHVIRSATWPLITSTGPTYNAALLTHCQTIAELLVEMNKRDECLPLPPVGVLGVQRMILDIPKVGRQAP